MNGKRSQDSDFFYNKVITNNKMVKKNIRLKNKKKNVILLPW